MMPWRVAHIQIRRIRFSTKSHSFHLNKRTVTQSNEASVASNFIRVPTLDHCKSCNCTLTFVLQARQRCFQPIPCIFEEWSIDGLKGFRCGGIHTHVELGYRDQVINSLGMLSIGHKKCRNLAFVKLMQQFIDSGVHDRLPNETQRTVSDFMCFCPTIHLNTWDTSGLLDHVNMHVDSLFNNHLWIICLPSPFPANRIFVMTPAEYAFIRTRQGRSCFHALV
mmetsp:Transcript_17479/g.29604  ORF Transcript_17479/g.29604 Transcript_17479/m.29604 type:complete len:222 (-) Transcript_17479:1409-2074(-)